MTFLYLLSPLDEIVVAEALGGGGKFLSFQPTSEVVT
jgi:hypothetical protein